MYDKTHYNIVISLQLIKKKNKKKIGFVAVSPVMNSFLMTPPSRLQESSICLFRNAWTL